jgi:hypothetical protein
MNSGVGQFKQNSNGSSHAASNPNLVPFALRSVSISQLCFTHSLSNLRNACVVKLLKHDTLLISPYESESRADGYQWMLCYVIISLFSCHILAFHSAIQVTRKSVLSYLCELGGKER